MRASIWTRSRRATTCGSISDTGEKACSLRSPVTNAMAVVNRRLNFPSSGVEGSRSRSEIDWAQKGLIFLDELAGTESSPPDHDDDSATEHPVALHS